MKHVKFVAGNGGVCELAGGVGVSLSVPELLRCAFVWFLLFTVWLHVHIDYSIKDSKPDEFASWVWCRAAAWLCGVAFGLRDFVSASCVSCWSLVWFAELVFQCDELREVARCCVLLFASVSVRFVAYEPFSSPPFRAHILSERLSGGRGLAAGAGGRSGFP